MLTLDQKDELQCGEETPSPASVRQPEPAPPFGSMYSEEEERILGPWQRARQRFLSPIAFMLSRLGISADMLSFASVILGFGFFCLAPFQFATAFWLLVASILCDGLDGVEARLTGTNTARGSLTDVFCDQVVVVSTVARLL